MGTSEHIAVRRRFWVSWVQDTEDYRPLGFPPNEQILGWWCSGRDAEDRAVLCACVVGEGESVGDQMRHATAAIEREWPEATSQDANPIGWRFFIARSPDWSPSGRFQRSDWMVERLRPTVS